MPELLDRKAAALRVEEILKEEIELARPDDLGFLELQVPYIAGRIVDSLLTAISSPLSP